MAQRHAAEIVTGAAVLLLAAGFMGYAVAHTGRATGSGYALTAKFDNIDGLNIGSDVRIGGVKVGNVEATALDPQTYQAEVRFAVRDDVHVPKDSSAVVTSDGLLGGKYLALQPGGDDQMLPPGGQIAVTQGSISIESLLGKFIFNAAGDKSKAAAPGSSTQPAAAQPASPAQPGALPKP